MQHHQLYRDTNQGDLARIVKKNEKSLMLEIVDGVHGRDGQIIFFDHAAFARQWVKHVQSL